MKLTEIPEAYIDLDQLCTGGHPSDRAGSVSGTTEENVAMPRTAAVYKHPQWL